MNPDVRARIVGGLLLALGAVSSTALGHDLEIDQLELWSPPGTTELVGQLTFDPELTRRIDSDLDQSLITRRISELVLTNLGIDFDGRACALQVSVREHYVRGGAVPGDVARVHCPIPEHSQGFQVRVGPAFPSLSIEVRGFLREGDEASQIPRASLVRGGSSSAVFRRAHPLAGDASAAEAPTSMAASDTTQGTSPASSLRQAGEYFTSGFQHVVPNGWDHILFVLGLTLGAWPRRRRLLLELSAFTLAHAITFGLAAAGLLLVPASIVEPAIALSIAYVGVENLRRKAPDWARLVAAVACGIVHGQGFVGVLQRLRLAPHEVLTSLVGFNLGVEAGQCAVAALGLSLLAVHARVRGSSKSLVTAGSWILVALGVGLSCVRIWNA